MALRPGTANSQVIEIENISNEDVYLYVTGRDIEPDYPHSIYGNMEIQMRRAGNASALMRKGW